MKRKVLIILLVAAAVVGLAWLREYLGAREEEAASEDNPYAAAVAEDHPLLQRFLQDHEGADVLLACADDVNADGTEDLIAIISGEEMNHTIAMISEDGGYFYTDEVPAPKENQQIGFTNIDKGEDLEVMITGEKNGQVGYAVFKLVGHSFKNLYGENMKDCC